MSGRPAVFLDRDGTLSEERGFIDRLELIEIFPWTSDAVRLLGRAGFAVAVVTNQSASKQLGQPDFVTATTWTPPTASTVTTTKGLIFDQQYIWIGDGGNHRLAVIPLP